jgi:hypothetical protein
MRIRIAATPGPRAALLTFDSNGDTGPAQVRVQFRGFIQPSWVPHRIVFDQTEAGIASTQTVKLYVPIDRAERAFNIELVSNPSNNANIRIDDSVTRIHTIRLPFSNTVTYIGEVTTTLKAIMPTKRLADSVNVRLRAGTKSYEFAVPIVMEPVAPIRFDTTTVVFTQDIFLNDIATKNVSILMQSPMESRIESSAEWCTSRLESNGTTCQLKVCVDRAQLANSFGSAQIVLIDKRDSTKKARLTV